MFDRLDLRVLARGDRSADLFPGTADQDGSPIRDPGQTDVLDRERAGGGREAKVRRTVERAPDPTIAGRSTEASRAARNVSPAPVGSVSRSVAVGR